jgi:hypothetical protein
LYADEPAQDGGHGEIFRKFSGLSAETLNSLDRYDPQTLTHKRMNDPSPKSKIQRSGQPNSAEI